MVTLEELGEYVGQRAKLYLEETGEQMDKFPTSIVDFVIEYVMHNCHFPGHFTEANMVADLEKGKNVLAMACAEVYGKAGAEGQLSHSENSISRSYESAWITPGLLFNFPNYVQIL